MSDDRRSRLEDWFHAISGLGREEQAESLRRYEQEDPLLAVELRTLLDSSNCDKRTTLALEALRSLADAAASEPGQRIGPYRVLDVVGEGATGAVYAAEQREPVRRLVAIKVLKPGMDSREVLRRFDGERAALARMDHPNIAAVLDAGLTPEGRPYFVMPLVQGPYITEYCDEAQLPVCERVALFAQVCAAVRHAHQRGIVHRDLKPSNILIVNTDAAPTAKVIDFGIAKALDGTDNLSTYQTEQGQAIGTPGYMSPEQAAGAMGAVDTRSDIYSLGVLLYELLCGQLPHDPARFRVIGPAAWAQEQRDGPTLPPSRRLCDDELSRTAAAARGAAWRALQRTLSNDLDRIAMRCLYPDPDRRYPTADALMDDLERWQNGLPVRAAPTGTWYVVGKFVGRHRAAVAVCAVLAAGVIAGGAGTGWYAVKARREEVQQRMSAGILNELVTGLSLDAHHKRDSEIIDRVLAKGRAAALTGSAKGPAGRADVLHLAGVAMARMDRPELAARRFAEAERLRMEEFGKAALPTLESGINRAKAMIDMGAHIEAAALLSEALPRLDALRTPARHAAAQCRAWLAEANLLAGDVAAALPLAERAVQDAAVVDSELTDEAVEFRLLAFRCLAASGDAPAAIQDCRAFFDRMNAQFGKEHPTAIRARVALAECLARDERHSEVVELLQADIASLPAWLDSDHRDRLAAERLLGLSLWAQRHRFDAAEHLRAALDGYARVKGPLARDTERVLLELKTCLVESRRFADAKSLLVKADAQRASSFPDGRDLVVVRSMLEVLLLWVKGGEMQDWWKRLPPEEAQAWIDKKCPG